VARYFPVHQSIHIARDIGALGQEENVADDRWSGMNQAKCESI